MGKSTKSYSLSESCIFMHIYEGVIQLNMQSRSAPILNMSQRQKKSCISPNYATFISTETKHSRRYPAEKWHLANLIMSVVVYYKTSSVTLLDNELVISSITTPEWSL